jgi:uncharacterized protein (DUF362 family)
MNRRDFLKLTAAATLSPVLVSCDNRPQWQKDAYVKPERSQIAILAAQDYGKPLRDTIVRGLKLCHLEVRGKKVVLKPNLVEFDPNGVINTHPAVIEAAVDAMRTLGAREVVIAEGPGHRRDNEYLLSSSGIYDVLREHHVRYVDLNTDNVRLTRLKSAFTRLGELYLPETLYDADLLVSMPKLKTHHWAGVTLSLKNMFGVVPGSVYGWPKNALHWAGINGSIIDINASLPLPRFAIVDGVVGMEGNGPLQGQAKNSGVLVFGSDLVAVDATAARLMKIEPRKVKYLADAAAFLGNLGSDEIEQIGEKIERHAQDFQVIEQFSDLKNFSS